MIKIHDKICHRCLRAYKSTWAAQRYCSDQCRFLSLVQFPNDLNKCWIWDGAIHAKGYGHFRLNGHIEKAQRASYRLFCGEPGNQHVLHQCDNPPCVNPDHLFLGTNDDNMKDRNKKGRQARGAKNHTARLTEIQVKEIRSSTLRPADLARKYNMSLEAIHAILKRRSWKHV